MPPKRSAKVAVPEASDEDFLRFYQSHKRLKATARTKDGEIARLKLALEASKAREKATYDKLRAAENLKLKWVGWWNEEKARADCLESELSNLTNEQQQTQPAEQKRHNELEAQIANLRDKDRRAESENAALQEQLSNVEAMHKQLLEKFNNYKKRMRNMGNEH